MLKKTTYFILLLAVFLVVISCSKSNTLTTIEKEYLKSNDSIKVALFPFYPPYQFVNKQERMDGIFVDFLNLMEKKINYKFKRVYYDDWGSLIEDSKNNQIDLILEIQRTNSRENFLAFYPPIFESQTIFAQRTGGKIITDLKDFGSSTLILPSDYGVVEIIKKRYPNIKIAYAKDDVDCLKMLNAGKYDGWVGPTAIFHYLVNKENLNGVSISANMDLFYKPGLAVNKKNKILESIIGKAFYGISSKEKKAIFDNWLFNPVKPFYEKLSFWILFSLGVASFALFIISVNYFLKYKIKKRTAELRIAKEKAEESDRLKSSFIQNISHEIRTPLNGIIGFSELLAKEDLSSQEQKEYAKIIIRNGNDLTVTIDNILEISRLESEKGIIRPEELDVSHLLLAIYQNYKAKAEEKGLSLILENKLEENQSKIIIDKGKLIKIINNLVDNAIKFTSKGTVLISCKVFNKSLVISIEDDGIGIKKKDQKNIFTSFSQSEKEISKNYGGLGLGLSIAKKNANLIGGDVSFTTKVGKGSTFSVILPYITVSNVKGIDTEKKALQNDKRVKQIVLIAEDGDVNFLFLKTILTKMPQYNFVIHRAENGKEAVEICKENPSINLVLMDIKMPIMDGYEATENIKKLRPKLPVIAQTAFSTDEDIQKAINAGCDDCISKPVDRNLLQTILSRYILI